MQTHEYEYVTVQNIALFKKRRSNNESTENNERKYDFRSFALIGSGKKH